MADHCSSSIKHDVYLPANSDNISENKLLFNETNSNKVQRLVLTFRVKNSRLRKQVKYLKPKQKNPHSCDGSSKRILELSRNTYHPYKLDFLKVNSK